MNHSEMFFCSFWLLFYPLDPDSRIRPDPGRQNLADPTDPDPKYYLHRIKNVEDTVVFLTRKRVYFCEVFHCKECASHFCSELANKNKVKKTLLSNSCLIRQNFQWYGCKPDIAIFAKMVN